MVFDTSVDPDQLLYPSLVIKEISQIMKRRVYLYDINILHMKRVIFICNNYAKMGFHGAPPNKA